ncbi:MAG: MarR family winged helix-turn-helix transcriptional regulator [Acidimicrobiales bacterium]
MSSQQGATTGGEGGEAASLGSQLTAAMRELSLESGFFVGAIATSMGMGSTDFACLSVLLREGPATAGRLMDRTGLTSGAITGVVDRLERGGWVRRETDPEDRRRVIVVALPDRLGDLQARMAPMLEAAAKLQGSYRAEQLRAVLSYVRDAARMLAEQTARTRVEGTGPGSAGAGYWSVAGVPCGRLRLVGTLSQVAVSAADLGDRLFDAELGPSAPAVRVRGGEVVVAFRPGRGRDRGARHNGGMVVLNAAIPWQVDVFGGASRLELDLRGADVRSVSVRGGASQVLLRLPSPSGVVPVVVAGGASRLRVERPSGSTMAVRVRGGASHLTLDGTELRAFWGDERFALGGPAGAPDRFELEVGGGASRLVVTAG